MSDDPPLCAMPFMVVSDNGTELTSYAALA